MNDTPDPDPYAPPGVNLSVEPPPEQRPNPHDVEKQAFGVAISGLIMAYFGAWLLVVCGVLVFVDAWLAGIYRWPGKKSFLNISPMGWGVCTHLLFILVFPIYMIARPRLKTRPGHQWVYIAVIAVGSLNTIALMLQVIYPEFVLSAD